MKAAVIILAAVSALLAGDSLSSASHIVRVSERYEVDTPAPSGQMECGVIMEFKKDGGIVGTSLFFELLVFEGEARMPNLFIQDGFQPGCPLYLPPGPTRTKLVLPDVPLAAYTQDFPLNVHAHPGSNCEVGGHARGVIYVEHHIGPETHPSLTISPVTCAAPQQAEGD